MGGMEFFRKWVRVKSGEIYIFSEVHKSICNTKQQRRAKSQICFRVEYRFLPVARLYIAETI